jgi:hypothetical protein
MSNTVDHPTTSNTVDHPTTCEVKQEFRRESNLTRDVQVATDFSADGNLKEDIEKAIDTSKAWSSSMPSTAIAISKGAAVFASAAPMARAWVNNAYIRSTKPITAQAKGRTDLQYSIINGKNDKNQVSAAVLTLVEADVDIDEEITEITSTAGKIHSVVELLNEAVGDVMEVALSVSSSVDVHLKMEATLDFKISPCVDAKDEIKVSAERRLKTDGKSISEPADDIFSHRECNGGLVSCTATESVAF